MSEISGKLINFKYRVPPETDWITIVCTEDSSFTITNDIATKETNCGIKAAPGIPQFNASGNAVQNVEPTALEGNSEKSKLKGNTMNFLKIIPKSKSLFLLTWLIILMFLEACFVKNANHSSFWDNFFSNQQLLIDKYADTDLYPILFGSLKPEEEKFLFKKDDKLYLSGYVLKQGNTLVPKIDDKENSTANDEYFTKIEYIKSEFKGRPTYKMKRRTSFKYPAYTIRDFFHWMEVFSSSVNSEEQLAILDRSIVYQFLCSEFKCNSELADNQALLSFSVLY